MGHTSGIRVNPISVVEVEGNVTRARDPVSAPGSLPSSDASPTRLGLLCRQLRLQGVDAAPHLLAQPAWESILQRCSDEAILGAAELARAKKPGCRIHLNYLIPILNQPPPQPGDDPPDARRRRDKQVEREAFFNELGVGNGSRSQTGRVIDLAAKRVG